MISLSARSPTDIQHSNQRHETEAETVTLTETETQADTMAVTKM